ncbi:MAG: ATP-binding protein [Acidobacteria bacterium]|nr:ATP-binding protein [Acidobacteriota bacterium]
MASVCECRRQLYEDPSQVPAQVLENHGVPSDISGRLREHWRPEAATWHREFDLWPSKIVDDAGTSPRFLFLSGSSGNGKSHAAAWIMRRALAKGMRCWWFDIGESIERTKREFSRQTDVPWWSWRIEKPLVVLDDIGAERSDSEFQQDLVYQWVATRYRLPVWTVVTSNLSPAELRESHPRAASRILSGPVIEMAGRDERRRKWTVR